MRTIFTISAFVFSVIFLAVCSSSKNVSTDPTANAWQVTQIGAQSLASMSADHIPTLAFDPVKRMVSGSTGCNVFSGSYTNDLTSLKFGTLAVTKKACEPDVMSVETAFIDALNRATRMKVDGDMLMLLDGTGTELLKAQAKSAL